jgi:Tat protein secretion system quality control protein TatD with DNase activity
MLGKWEDRKMTSEEYAKRDRHVLAAMMEAANKQMLDTCTSSSEAEKTEATVINACLVTIYRALHFVEDWNDKSLANVMAAISGNAEQTYAQGYHDALMHIRGSIDTIGDKLAKAGQGGV